MCGLAAWITRLGAPVDEGALQRMADSIKHRGPDDAGTHVANGVGFAFRRLAILDLSPNGHQPMASPDGDAVIVFNGEIYNYVELRAELEQLGHRFRSGTDTEVLLAAWREWGRDCLPKLNGMWAMLIHDVARQRVFGSRDRYGVKPLYLHRAGDVLLFGSEIKAIRASGRYQGAPNWDVVRSYLLTNDGSAGDRSAATFFAGIEQVPAGSAFEIDLASGAMQSWVYSRLDDVEATSLDDPPAAFAELFEDAIRLELRSDVPVGVCLSGGLDSTSILCAMARQWPADSSPPRAFAYAAAGYDEVRYVDDTIARTGAVLHRTALADAVPWSTFERLLWIWDQPVHSSAAMVGHELMKMAAGEGIKVMLNGQGADEVLGGYGSHFQHAWFGLARRGRWLRAWREISEWTRAHGGQRGALYRRALGNVVRYEAQRFEAYRARAVEGLRARVASVPWFEPDFTREFEPAVAPRQPFDLHSTLLDSIQHSPLPLYLRVEDRNSMAWSIESRVPFLDHRLVRFAVGLPDRWKVRGPWNKILLREAMRGRIPESVRSRVDKMGFPTQQRDWFRGPWYEPMQDLLGSRDVRERGIVRVDALREGLEAHRRGDCDISQSVLITVAQLELWLRQGSGAAAAHAGSPPPTTGRFGRPR